MATWMRMVAAVLVVLLPGGLVFLIALALGRTVHVRVREAASAQHREPHFVWKALMGIRLPEVWREARRMYVAAP